MRPLNFKMDDFFHFCLRKCLLSLMLYIQVTPIIMFLFCDDAIKSRFKVLPGWLFSISPNALQKCLIFILFYHCNKPDTFVCVTKIQASADQTSTGLIWIHWKRSNICRSYCWRLRVTCLFTKIMSIKVASFVIDGDW